MIRLFTLAFLSFLLSIQSYAAPEATVDSFHTALLEAMKINSFDERVLHMQEAVDAHFQVSTIARISLGRNWRSLSTDEQSDHQSLIRELMTTTYADRFNHYDGQVFETLGTSAMSKNRFRVKSVLTTASEQVNLDYQLQEVDGRWRIYDIIANGVSDLSLKRSNFSALFGKGGLSAVSEDIRTSISKNREESSG